MRKLASIQRIKSISPIPGADRIVEAVVLGWKTVVKKGEFQEGDLCVFFEVDSILPEAPWSEFMRPRKFRVKTSKIKGVLSQGLTLPLTILTEDQKKKLSEGSDITDLLKVSKYEPPILDLVGGHIEQEGPFPTGVPKTDEERVQSKTELLDLLSGQPYAITVKVDGASVTCTFDRDDTFRVAARNFTVKFDPEKPSKHWVVAKKYRFEEILKDTGLAVQGELVGPGLQKNRLRLTEPELFVFNVWDWKNCRHYGHDELVNFCKAHNLRMVPIEETGERFSYSLEALLEKAKGIYAGTNNRREGIVVRSAQGRRLSFKVLNNEFLLEDDE